MPKIKITILFLVVVASWFMFVAPILLKLPSNFRYDADVVSVDNFYDPELKTFKGEQYSKTKFYYEVIANNQYYLDIRNVFEVQTVDFKTVFKAEPVYKVDSITGVVVNGSNSNESYLFAPRNLKRNQSFDYRHVTSTEPLTMKYDSEEYLYGLKVYKYKKDNSKPFDQTQFLTFHQDVGITKGVELISDVNLWIEPITGYVVKIEDFSTDYYYFDLKTREKLYPYNKFLNTYSEESVKSHAQKALYQKTKSIIVLYVVPITLLLIAVLTYLLMSKKITNIKEHTKTFGVSISVFLLFGIVSLLVNRYIVKNRDVYFNDKSIEIKLLLEKGLSNYVNALWGGRGMFDASDNVTAKEWEVYVNSLDLKNNYPGVQAFGYAKYFSKDKLKEVEQDIRSQGYSDFSVFPLDGREFYTSIVYIEPRDDRNLRALGFDMYSEQTRRQAMAKSIETGLPSSSAKVTLLQETDSSSAQSGFLMYLPHFENEVLEGFVYGAFRVEDLINSMFVIDYSDLDIKIYDGLKTTEENLIYSSRNVPANKILFKKSEVLHIAGNVWTIVFTNSKNYSDSLTDKMLPYIFLTAGFVVSLLALIIIRTISNSEKKAIAYAKELNHELEQNKLDLTKKNSELEEKIKEASTLNKLMVDRELKMIEMKKETERTKNEFK